MSKRLILASSSPYRRALLERLGLPFEVVSPDIDESALLEETPQALVLRLALAKARRVAEAHAGALVIGSDQVAVHDGLIVGKPGTHDKAVAQLRAASGKTITLYTGLAVMDSDTGAYDADVIPFRVHFRELADDEIERYLRKEQPYHCAGSVRAEGLGIALLQRFEGDDPNALIGLPLIRLVDMLRRHGLAVV